jgi:hypothetical protein
VSVLMSGGDQLQGSIELFVAFRPKDIQALRSVDSEARPLKEVCEVALAIDDAKGL